MFQNDKLFISLQKNIQIHVMKIDPCLEKKEYNRPKVDLKRVKFPPNMELSALESLAVKKPCDGKIGLILFQGSNNYIPIGNSKINHRDAIELSIDESILLESLRLGIGLELHEEWFILPQIVTLSKVTKKRNSFLFANKKSAGLTCHYANN